MALAPSSLGLERGDGSRRDRRGTALIDARLLSGGNALQLALAAHVRLKLGEHAQHPEERLARLRSLAQWGLLRMGEEPGSLVGPPQRVRINDEVAQLLLHSVVLGHGRGLPYPQLVDHPALFPFASGCARTRFDAEFNLSRADGRAISQTLSSWRLFQATRPVGKCLAETGAQDCLTAV